MTGAGLFNAAMRVRLSPICHTCVVLLVTSAAVRLQLSLREAITAIIAVIAGRVLAWTMLTTALSLGLPAAAIWFVPTSGSLFESGAALICLSTRCGFPARPSPVVLERSVEDAESTRRCNSLVTL
jgi:hypothetical protein